MKLIKSFSYAYNGLVSATKEQLNLKVHFAATVAVTGAGIYFKISSIEWAICLLLIGLVISLELVNSAIEGLVDLVEPNKNPLAGKVKDIAAAAVLIASLIATVVGLIIFLKYVL